MLTNIEYKPKMLFAVCFPEKAEWMIKTLKEGDAHNITADTAWGMKKSNFADLLGLVGSKRVFITAIINQPAVAPLFERLQKELFHEPNTGLAFTVNVDAYAGAKAMTLIDLFLKNFQDTEDSAKAEKADAAAPPAEMPAKTEKEKEEK